MASLPGQIKITTGQFTNNECTANYDLIANSANYPQIRNLMEIVQRRQMTTLITSGAITPYGVNYDVATSIPNVEASRYFGGKTSTGVGSLAYQFRMMGRIEETSTILGQVGSSGADGTFTLKMQDQSLFIGANPLFYGGRKTARVMAGPRPSGGGYLYDFKIPTSGETFDYATWVTPQAGTKTCFVGWTTYGEKSLKGYGYSKFPDMFVNHMTTQRGQCEITGDANTQVLWVNYMGTDANGQATQAKGWYFQQIAQEKAKLGIRNERAKLFGVSDMKTSTGALATTPTLTDYETGYPITTGDGIEEQIGAGNVVYGSGPTGQPTYDDYKDMMSKIQQNGDFAAGNVLLFVGGTVAFNNAQEQISAHIGAQNVQLMQPVTQVDKAGGAEVAGGYTFYRMNFGGNSAIFCIHPLLDDRLAFPEIGSDGNLISSGTIFVLPLKGVVEDGGGMNMEMLHKEAFGMSRAFVEGTLNGLTGAPEMVVTMQDSKTYGFLKQDMIVVYNPQICGMIYPTT